MDTITYDEFARLDIRIGTIESVQRIEGADKLLKIIVDLGSEKRQILAGIAQFVEDIDSLVGRQIPVLANLAPRRMRGLESQGMMLAADCDGRPVLMHPAELVPPGSKIS